LGRGYVLAALCVVALTPPGVAATPQLVLPWGRYAVRIEAPTPEGQEARILSGGRTQVRIRGWRLEASLVEVTGRPPKELLVTDWSGGAHCCYTHYLFTQEGGLRNLMAAGWHDGGIREVQDLDGDGRGELVTVLVLAYFGGLSFAHSPGVVLVYAYDGMQLYDATRRLSAPTLREMRADRTAFLRARRSGDVEAMKGHALGYWANALVVGRGVEAKRWLMRNAPVEVRRWLLANAEAVLKLTSAVPVSYRRTLPDEDR
jgi:hypothetical protein